VIFSLREAIMRVRCGVLMCGLALGLWALLPSEARAFDGVPPGSSDRVRLLNPEGSVTADVSVPEPLRAVLESPLSIPCAICRPGAAVGLVEPGGRLSDVMFVAELALVFESDTEGGPVLDPLPGMVFLQETGEPQDVSALILSPTAIAAGFTMFAQSDAKVPAPTSGALLALGTFSLCLAGRPWSRAETAVRLHSSICGQAIRATTVHLAGLEVPAGFK
jgi:hypothetical protein